MSIDYKVENGKLLVTFKVYVDLLESVGVFIYGPSWEDKQGRFHKATTADDARRSTRSAVESVKQHAVSELTGAMEISITMASNKNQRLYQKIAFQ